MLLFQDIATVTDTINRAWEVSPYNALGYGLSLVVLIIVSMIFFNNWRQEVKYSRQRDNKVIEFNNVVIQWMQKVEIRLEDQQSYGHSLTDIKNTIEDVLRTNEEIKSLILKHLRRNT